MANDSPQRKPGVHKKLTRHGNSYALVIDKPILDLLGIDTDTMLELTTDGQGLTVKPVKDSITDAELTAAMVKGKKRYGNMLKRLAEQAMDPRFLAVEHVLAIHQDVIESYGGSMGLRDQGLLESAVAMPRASFDGQFVHGDLAAMAGAYAFYLCRNHPFFDGNKRVAAQTAFVLLELNGVDFSPPEDQWEAAIMAVAASETGKEQITEFIRKYTQPS